jgi:hypothetical protein
MRAASHTKRALVVAKTLYPFINVSTAPKTTARANATSSSTVMRRQLGLAGDIGFTGCSSPNRNERVLLGTMLAWPVELCKLWLRYPPSGLVRWME